MRTASVRRTVAAALVAGALGTTGGVAQAAPQQDDFVSGLPQHVNTAVVGGGVELPLAFNETFDTAVSTAWTTTPWTLPPPSECSVAGQSKVDPAGTMVVDGARVDSKLGGPGSSLAFTATFAGKEHQHVGFGVDFNDTARWAMFSTGPATNMVFARTLGGTPAGAQSFPLGDLTGSQHDYRIDWNASSVDFWVDGVKVHTEPVTINEPMTAQVSDCTTDSTPVAVDSMALRTNKSGTFTSRTFDAGSSRVSGITFTPESATPAPAGTGIVYETSTSSDNSSWTTFSSGAIQPARYFKYRAIFSTTNLATPRLTKASVDFQIAADPQPGTGNQPPSGGNTVDTKKPKLAMPRDADVSKRGKLRLLLTCPDDETRCKVALKLKWNRATVASKSGKINGGDSRYIALKLSNAAKKKLAKAGKLKVVATLTVTDAAGNKRTSSKKLWLYSL